MAGNRSIIILVVGILAIATLACGSDNTGTKVGEKYAQPTSAPQIQIYQAGDIVQVGDHTIVLNEATVTNGTVKANFTIENKGSSNLAVSSLLSFESKDSEGTKLEIDIFDCGTSSLDGEVLPGDKLKGNICWKGATTPNVKIYYHAVLFGSGAVVWEVK